MTPLPPRLEFLLKEYAEAHFDLGDSFCDDDGWTRHGKCKQRAYSIEKKLRDYLDQHLRKEDETTTA